MGVKVEGLQSADAVPDSSALQVQESLPLF
jgi:hypothetical protein